MQENQILAYKIISNLQEKYHKLRKKYGASLLCFTVFLLIVSSCFLLFDVFANLPLENLSSILFFLFDFLFYFFSKIRLLLESNHYTKPAFFTILLYNVGSYISRFDCFFFLTSSL